MELTPIHSGKVATNLKNPKSVGQIGTRFNHISAIPASMKWEGRSQTARRIAAARILHGWDQAELNRRLSEAEVGEDMGWRLENDDTGLPGPRREAVARVLGVPPEWLTAPLEQILGLSQFDDAQVNPILRRLERIEELLVDLAPGELGLPAAQEHQGRERGRPSHEETHPASGNHGADEADER